MKRLERQLFQQFSSVALAVAVVSGAGGAWAQQTYAPCADANGDCQTNIVDALYIAQSTVGLRTLTCPGAPAAGPRFVDNGDGTVGDTKTGLTWEKKTNDGSLHDVTKTFTWSLLPPWNFDGSAKTAFLDKLNDVAGGGAHCFAGHCDWRLPTVGVNGGTAELETIVGYTLGLCGGGAGACVDPALGPTSPSVYWSSTPFFNPSFPDVVTIVGFNDGTVGNTSKSSSWYVRAVRSGL